MAGTYEQAKVGDPNSTAGPKWVAQFLGMNEALNSENDLQGKEIEKGFLGRWYTPVSIAKEETRESTSFGTLTTPDEVKSVVLPENGLIVFGYSAKWKSSVAAAGRVTLFLGANQLKEPQSGATTETETLSSTSFHTLSSTSATAAFTRVAGETAFPTTGTVIREGVAYIFAAAGTYNVSVQFRATSGSVTAKERKLWVGVMGV